MNRERFMNATTPDERSEKEGQAREPWELSCEELSDEDLESIIGGRGLEAGLEAGLEVTEALLVVTIDILAPVLAILGVFIDSRALSQSVDNRRYE